MLPSVFSRGRCSKIPMAFLSLPDKNSQAICHQIRFTNVKDITHQESIIASYIKEAIEIEQSGLKVRFKTKEMDPIPNELHIKFLENPTLKIAFEALTPGRQRGYILHLSAPKQSKTRTARIEKWVPHILNDMGIHHR